MARKKNPEQEAPPVEDQEPETPTEQEETPAEETPAQEDECNDPHARQAGFITQDRRSDHIAVQLLQCQDKQHKVEALDR